MASHSFPVAVIGMAVTLPAANNCEEFWELMINRSNKAMHFPDKRKEDIKHVVETFNNHLLDEGNPFLTGSFFKSVDKFDADMFHIYPKEVIFMDPEQRMFLETVWEAIEDAAYASKIRNSNTGVYVGHTVNKYKYILTENHPSISHGNHSSLISSRVSNTLNLSGPAMMVEKDCSSSLMAVHLACQGLLSGDCDMTIAGGISLDLLPFSTKIDIWKQLGITGQNAKCRAFDEKTTRTANGEGIGVVILKPLDKAIANGDNIYGILESTTANQDDHSQGVPAQANMLNQAWKLANINPEALGYTEALCTDGAAGVVGLIKTLLCLRHNKIPPAVHFEHPNPHISWKKAPVYVNTKLADWKSTPSDQPRYCGVSAFGFLGTNVHAVVRDYPVDNKSNGITQGNPCVLCLAAKSPKSLKLFIEKMYKYFTIKHDIDYAHFRSVCFTLNTGRELKMYTIRHVAIADSWNNMTETLKKLLTQLGDNNPKVTPIVECTISSENKIFASSLDLPQKQKHVIDKFTAGNSINWDEYYLDSSLSEKKIIGQLPTYSFHQVRYWPNISKPVNNETLRLQHHMLSSENRTCLHPKPELKTKPAEYEADESHITNLLTETLDLEGNQCEKYSFEKDLMAIGEDSLMLTQTKMKFQTCELSSSQKRMFALQTTVPDSTAYTETITITTKQHLQPEYLSKVIGEMHPILTAKIDRDGGSMKLPYAIDCISETQKFESSADLRNFLTETLPAFDTRDGPLAQMRIFTKAEQFVIVIHAHRIIADDSTMKRIQTSLRRILDSSTEAITQRFQSMSSALYTDYVQSEKEYIQSQNASKDLLYWQTVFDKCPDTVSLSLKSSTVESDDLAAQTAKTLKSNVTQSVVDEIKSFCKYMGITEFHYTLACFCVVLQRYLGTQDILIAVPVSIRGPSYQETDGLFVNTVLFRYKMNIELTFKQHALCVSKSWMAALTHSRYPLDKVSQVIWEKFGVSVSSLCTIMFKYGTFQLDDDEYQIEAKHAKTQISINVVPGTEGFDIICEYADKLIDDGISTRLNESLILVLTNGFRWQSGQLKTLDTLSEKEQNIIASVSNSVIGKDIETELVHEMFTKHAIRYPDKEAIYSDGKSLTYRKVLSIANLIAVELKDVGELRDQPVLLYMEKDVLIIAAMFGVWIAGGHFLPVSVKHSPCLETISKRISPCAVIINKSGAEIKERITLAIIDISEVAKRAEDMQRDKHEDKRVSLDDTAYVIQTSGSTGKPKRIAISHRNISVISSAWKQVYNLSSFQVSILQWAPVSFDVCIGDVLRGLCCVPGKLCLCPEGKRLDTQYISQLIRHQEITFAEVTPQFGLLLVESASNSELMTLRCLVLGSDVLQQEVYTKIKTKLTGMQRLFNSYGMSEATIDSAFFEEDTLPVTRGGTVPIGRPLPGVTLHVLEPATLRTCPVGTVGELYIGGPVVGTGDTKLVQHTFGILLKTNDTACLLPSGHLELLDRTDNIRKLRGFRINTVEIENTVLKNVSDVLDVAVAILDNNERTKHTQFLCAFVVYHEVGKFDEKEIQNVIRHHHPYYMVPDIITLVEKIPITQNGKVDKRALPKIKALFQNRPKKELTISDTAAKLRLLFTEALGVEDVSTIDIDRTFMEQGGNSLILVRFHSLVKQQTKFNVEIADIFAYPSISSLAEYMEQVDRPTFKAMD